MSIKIKDESKTYAEILRKARQEIPLAELKIENPHIRKDINGSIIIEIDGPDGKEKTDTLARKLIEVLDNEAKISRPTIRAELRIIGLDDSVTVTEIEHVISDLGCPISEVRSSEIRWMRNGPGAAWVQCPLIITNKIMETGKFRIGWTVVCAELVRKRPIQCYKCWAFDHVGFSCRAEVDRKGHCYFCGKAGHTARYCTAEAPDCLLCKERATISSQTRIH